jgi:hypothetical protein
VSLGENISPVRALILHFPFFCPSPFGSFATIMLAPPPYENDLSMRQMLFEMRALILQRVKVM